MSKTKWERSECSFRSCTDMNRNMGGGPAKYRGVCGRHYQAIRDTERSIQSSPIWSVQIIDPVSLRLVIRARYKQLRNHTAGFCAADCIHSVPVALEKLKAIPQSSDITPGRRSFESIAEYEVRLSA